MEELGNLMSGVCCEVGFEDGSWLGIIDLLNSFIYFSYEYKLVKLFPSFPF